MVVETDRPNNVNIPSYEVVNEALFGRTGFVFVAVSMCIVACAAIWSYLMIVNGAFGDLFGHSTGWVFDAPMPVGSLCTVFESSRFGGLGAESCIMNVKFDLIS